MDEQAYAAYLDAVDAVEAEAWEHEAEGGEDA